MNDAWDPVDELEPLDEASLGLLASFRDAQGPSEDSQARMLAGLRARIAAESSADDPAAAVAPRPAPEVSRTPRTRSTSANVRTLVIASVAFAAGVALTLSLASPDASGPVGSSEPGPGDRVASHAPGVQASGNPDLPSAGPNSSALVVPTQTQAHTPELAWPLSMADLSVPEHVDEETDEETAGFRSVDPPSSAPQQDDRSQTRQRSGVVSPDDDPIAVRGATRHRGTGPSASDGGSRGSATGAWTPSLTPPSGAGAGIGSAARNPALGGPTPSQAGNGGSSQSGSSQDGSPGDPGAQDGGSDDSPPKTDQPEPDSDESESKENEEEEEPEEEEPSEEEQCEIELDACLADAEEYCEYGFEGCQYVYDFCLVRAESCLGGPPPFDPPPPPDEPEPYDCINQYEMCIMETDSLCMFGKIPPEECEIMYWSCDDMLASCEGQPPPPGPPPW